MDLRAPQTLKFFLEQFIGVYTPNTTDLYDSNGHLIAAVTAEGAAGVDWAWIASAILVIVLIYCLFRILEAIIRGI